MQEALDLLAESVVDQMIRRTILGVRVRDGMRLLSLALEPRADAARPVQPSSPRKVGRRPAGDGAHGMASQPGTPRKPRTGPGRARLQTPSKRGNPAGRGSSSLQAGLPAGIRPSLASARISAGIHEPARLRARSAPSCLAFHHRERNWFASPIRLAWNEPCRLPASSIRQLGQGVQALVEWVSQTDWFCSK